MTTTWSPVLQGGLSNVLPAGFAIPSLVYVVPVVLTLLFVGVLLFLARPPVTDYTAVAFTPWIATGASLHVLYQQPAFYDAVRPLFGAPMVYLTTAIVAGSVWFFAEVINEMRDRVGSVDLGVGTVGVGVLVVVVGYSLYIGSVVGTLQPFWPVVGIALSAMGAAFAWIALSFTFTETAKVTGRTGAVVVFGHVLDGVSTAVGVDLLSFGERTPLSRIIIDYAATLPTAEVIGAGWLFLLVKILLALFVLVAFEEYVEEMPTRARVILLAVAALGLGPGAHNMLLFTVTRGPAAALGI